MDVKRILIALLKALCSVATTFVICGLITLFLSFIKIIFGVSIATVVLYLAIFLCILVITITYYKEGGKNE